MLKSYFVDEIGKYDPCFYARLENSKYYLEDKDESVRTVNAVFNDDNFKDADIAIFNGCDLMLSTLGEKVTDIVLDNNSGQQALRKACHNILYTIANSNAQELSKSGLSTWVYVMGIVDVLLLALVIFGLYKVAWKKRK